MKQTVLILLAIFIGSLASAQTHSVKGTISDTLNKQNLEHAVVAALRQKDSVLVKFTRSDASGKFELKNLPQGPYLIMVTYPAYADYFQGINIDGSNEESVGTIKMTLKSKLLEDVLVRSKIAAIRLKGDTVEYKADSFKVSAGASVEEMLRKLPGLQVDKDGNITAQGTKVEKVLVDGDEFFGDDPTMATKNLQADAIDKVQVFDKKSDQAAFTGIDDGQKTRTINLTLKEDKKKGYFGKAELKAGPDDKWSNTAMINAFKGKRKLSGYGIMSSTGATGLSWEDKDKYGEGNNMEYNADEGYFYSYSSSDEFDNGNGRFGGEGLPKNWSAGINYGNKFNADKQNINGSYRFNKLNNEGSGATFTQSILQKGILNTHENRTFNNSRERHSVNGTADIQLDSFTSIKVTVRGNKGQSNSSSGYRSLVTDSLGYLLNESNRSNFSKSDNNSFNSSLLFRKRFRKTGRTLSWNFDEQYKGNNSNGFLLSISDIYQKDGTLLRKDTVDQNKKSDSKVMGYSTRLAYTEPIIKNLFIELSYGLRLTQSESERRSYDNEGGKYEKLNSLYSNHFDYRILTNTAGTMLRYNGKKLTVSGGGDVGRSSFRQTDLLKDTVRNNYYTNFFPRANFQYKFNANSRVSINYNGNTRQPTIEQVQPVRENSNPLNVAIGNPSLKQEFRHSFSLNYNFYKVLTQRGLYTFSSFNTVSNAISTNERTFTSGDSAGMRIFQYVNLNGNYSMYGGGGYNIKLKKADMNLSAGFNFSVDRYNTIVNNEKNVSDNKSVGVRLFLYKYKEKKYNASYSHTFNYNTSTSSINKGYKPNFYSQTLNFNLNITLPARFEVNTTVDATFRQRINEGDVNNNVILWNGYIGRKLFKNDKAIIRIEANDILDQNKGYSRYNTANTFRENSYETLRRYFLLAFVWNFSKTPGGVPASK